MDESDEREAGSRQRGMLRWALPIGAVCVAGLIVALVGVLLTGGQDASASQPTATPGNFAASAAPSLERLTDSAMVTGRILARASDERDIARIGRTAVQQLQLVQAAQARIAGLPARAEERTARGALSRAAQAHRAYLSSLARLPDLAAPAAAGRLDAIHAGARRAVGRYREFFALVPDAPRGITAAGLADLTGLDQAIDAKARAERERAAQEAAAAERSADASRSSVAPTPDAGTPTISRVSATDMGAWIEVAADYCDRTPGAVNQFVYTFRIQDADDIIRQDSYSAAQTRACNTIAMSFDDTLPLGDFSVVVVVDNLTNAVRASGLGSGSVID